MGEGQIEEKEIKGVSLKTFYTVIASTVIIMVYIGSIGNKIEKLTDKVGFTNEMTDIKIKALNQRLDLQEIDIKEMKREIKSKETK